MPGDRMRRVNEAVREVVSLAVASDLQDPRIGFVTVTGVETSPDLRHAVVFVSVLGDAEEREETLAALADARRELQHEIALHLRMKNTPKLRFSYDDSVDRGMRITELISDQLKDTAEEPPADHAQTNTDGEKPNE